jgi:hypothetical protein
LQPEPHPQLPLQQDMLMVLLVARSWYGGVEGVVLLVLCLTWLVMGNGEGEQVYK